MFFFHVIIHFFFFVSDVIMYTVVSEEENIKARSNLQSCKSCDNKSFVAWFIFYWLIFAHLKCCDLIKEISCVQSAMSYWFAKHVNIQIFSWFFVYAYFFFYNLNYFQIYLYNSNFLMWFQEVCQISSHEANLKLEIFWSKKNMFKKTTCLQYCIFCMLLCLSIELRYNNE